MSFNDVAILIFLPFFTFLFLFCFAGILCRLPNGTVPFSYSHHAVTVSGWYAVGDSTCFFFCFFFFGCCCSRGTRLYKYGALIFMDGRMVGNKTTKKRITKSLQTILVIYTHMQSFYVCAIMHFVSACAALRYFLLLSKAVVRLSSAFSCVLLLPASAFACSYNNNRFPAISSGWLQMCVGMRWCVISFSLGHRDDMS